MKPLTCSAGTILVAIVCMGSWLELRGDSKQTDSAHSSPEKTTAPTIVITFGIGAPTGSMSNLGVEYTVYRFAKENALYMHSLRVSAGIGYTKGAPGYAPFLVRSILLDYKDHVEVGLGINVLWSAGDYFAADMGRSPVNPLAVLCYRHEPQDWGIVYRFTIMSMYDFAKEKMLYAIGFEFGFGF